MSVLFDKNNSDVILLLRSPSDIDRVVSSTIRREWGHERVLKVCGTILSSFFLP